MGKIQRRGRLFSFTPFLYDDGEDVKWFHFDCLTQVLNFADAEETEGVTDCAFCPEDLIGEPECYELELSQFEIRGQDTWWMTPTNEWEAIRSCACKECIEFAIGEGDGAEMRRRLGKKPEPQDKVRWINYEEVPKSMKNEEGRVVPPHLRRTGRRPPGG